MKGLLKKHPNVSILLVTVLVVLFILSYFARGGLSQTSAKADESKVVQQPVTVVQEETKKEPAEKQMTYELQKQAPVPADTQTPSNEQQATIADAAKAPAPEEPKKVVEPQSQPKPPAEVKQPEEPASQPQQAQSQPPAEVKQPETPKAIDNTDYLSLIKAKEPRFICQSKSNPVLIYKDKDWGNRVVIGKLRSERIPLYYQIKICQMLPENFDIAEIALTEFIEVKNANELIATIKKMGADDPRSEIDYKDIGKKVIYYSMGEKVYIEIYCT
jgi:DNA mismatch repair ATPase MutL